MSELCDLLKEPRLDDLISCDPFRMFQNFTVAVVYVMTSYLYIESYNTFNYSDWLFRLADNLRIPLNYTKL